MSRQCEITGKKPQVGNNVSHANNRTKRRFLPNLQEASFYSSGLKRSIKITASTHGIRTVEHKGGLDAFLLDATPSKLNAELRKVRKQLLAKIGPQEKPAPKKRVVAAKKPAKKKAAA